MFIIFEQERNKFFSILTSESIYSTSKFNHPMV